ISAGTSVTSPVLPFTLVTPAAPSEPAGAEPP
ncbi:hypothetical protein D049_3075B, partial [Vibrio parahaemolyticus VPTS-2010]